MAIVTSYTGTHAALLGVALPSLAAHAEFYGHDVILVPTVEPPLHFDHSKIAALRRALLSYEAAIWLDGDTVIMDGAPDIARIVDSPLALQWTDAHRAYCTQIMAARRDARALLDRVWAARCELPLDDLHGALDENGDVRPGVLQQALGPPGPMVHRLWYPSQLFMLEHRSERLGGLGVIHAAASNGLGGVDAAVERLQRAGQLRVGEPVPVR